MKIVRKLLIAAGATLALTSGTLAATPHVAAASLESIKMPQVVRLQTQSNDAFELDTEINAGSHTLTATVTNKTDKSVVPHITFDGKEPLYDPEVPVEPGKNVSFAYNFTGNNFVVAIKIAADGLKTLESFTTVSMQEPVSFKATETNETTIIGKLQNNSTLVPQTVYTRVAAGEVRIEYLEPGETRTIAMSHRALAGQLMTGVTIATSAGYESNYLVELGLKPLLLPTH